MTDYWPVLNLTISVQTMNSSVNSLVCSNDFCSPLQVYNHQRRVLQHSWLSGSHWKFAFKREGNFAMFKWSRCRWLVTKRGQDYYHTLEMYSKPLLASMYFCSLQLLFNTTPYQTLWSNTLEVAQSSSNSW